MRSRSASREALGGRVVAFTAGAALLLSAGAACSERLATAEDCAILFDRIVENELREKGYRDRALVLRKTEALRGTYASELRRCVGRALPKGALDCVRGARSNEDLSHKCLR